MLNVQLLQKYLCILWVLSTVARTAVIPGPDFSLANIAPENQHKWDTISRIRSRVGPTDKSPRDRLVDSGKQAKVFVDWPRPSADVPKKVRPSAKDRKRKDSHKPNNVAELNRSTKPLSVKLNAGHVGYEERHRFRGIPFEDLLDTKGTFLDEESDGTDGTFRELQGTDLSGSDVGSDTDAEFEPETFGEDVENMEDIEDMEEGASSGSEEDIEAEAEADAEAEDDVFDNENFDESNQGDSTWSGPEDEESTSYDEANQALEEAAHDSENEDSENDDSDSDGENEEICNEENCSEAPKPAADSDVGDDIHWRASSRSKVASIQAIVKRQVEPLGWQYSSRSKAGKWGRKKAQASKPETLHWKSSSKSKVDPVSSLQEHEDVEDDDEEEAPEMPLHWESSSHSKASEMFPPYDENVPGDIDEFEDFEEAEDFDESGEEFDDFDDFEEPPELHWTVSSQSKAADLSFEQKLLDQNHVRVNRASLKRKPAAPVETYVPGPAGATIRIHREKKIT